MERTHTGAGEKGKEEGMAERNCYGLNTKLKASIVKEKNSQRKCYPNYIEESEI